MAREDCFAFDLEHRSGAGFGDRGDCPPTIQLAFEYVSLEKMCDPPGEEDEEGTEGPETATEPGTHRLDRDRDRHPPGSLALARSPDPPRVHAPGSRGVFAS